MNYNDFTGNIVQHVYCAPFYNNGYNCLTFVFDDYSALTVKVNPDTDELVITQQAIWENDVNNMLAPPWSSQVKDKRVISYWIATNNVGYQDVLLLGLDEFLPSIVLTAISSCIEVSFTGSASEGAVGG